MGFFDFMYKPKYRIVFLRKEYDAMFVLKIKTLSNIKNLNRINEKQFVVDINLPAYIHKNVYTYLVDFDTGAQLHNTIVAERQMKPEELDLIVGTKMIRELTRGVIDNSKDKILWAIIGLVIGALIAVAVMQNIMAEKIAEVQTTQSYLPVLPVVGNIWNMTKLAIKMKLGVL